MTGASGMNTSRADSTNCCKMLNITDFSSRYRVRRLTESDLPMLFSFCAANPQYYRSHSISLSEKLILEDMTILPDGKTSEDKYYVGFFDGGDLIAVIDLIDGYPAPDIAYIGFFMVAAERSGKGVGSAIIDELCGVISDKGFSAVRLAFGKENPQSSRFWKKNRFEAVLETVHEKYGRVIVAQRKLDASY